MPRGDQSGPEGRGPMTGRGMGTCAGGDAAGWANWGPGRGFPGRRGRGMRRGRWGGMVTGRGPGGMRWQHWYHATGRPRWARQGVPPAWAYDAAEVPPSQEQEVEMLREQAEWLKEQLDAVNKQMDELTQG
ncbi:DUF5320 domain-containing protein [Chloroflexota bacterium]